MSARILVVEDNALNSELLSDWLEREGYEAQVAADLAAAMAAVAAVPPPDAVLLDVQLGNDNGLELAATIRRQPALRHIPIIAVTAHAMVDERRSILHAGCNACLSKPVDLPALREHLKRWLAHPVRPSPDS